MIVYQSAKHFILMLLFLLLYSGILELRAEN